MWIEKMEGFKAKFRLGTIVIFSFGIVLIAIFELLKPISNGCNMTYMYPTYIPISAIESLSSSKYGLFLYNEGWKKIDYDEHLKQLNGVPVLFIPGNGGSYKQVRSLAAESDRAYQGGPPEPMLYQEASLMFEEGVEMDETDIPVFKQYTRRLDWFAVDLEGEHSAMDGQILEEHTEYVVYAIHRILDQYRDARDARVKEGAVESSSLPTTVVLVGHSMGGFVARAAVVHPALRKSAVETVVTLSTPHQSPPVALQPSLGHYYEFINQEWRKGYEVRTSKTGTRSSGPQLSRVIVVSISGGGNDYQVRSKLESLDGIVPSTHGFMISSMGMKNVWLSMEHQVILWCNQLVVQVSHTLLSLVDHETGHWISGTRKRLAILTKMLHSGMPGSLSRQLNLFQQSAHLPLQKERKVTGSQAKTACPSKIHWSDAGLEKDLYIKTPTVTILAMDGRRRWLDIKELGSNGRDNFVLVTNLLPCYGIRLHLWPENGTSASVSPRSKRVVEVTSKITQIPSGPAPRQIEPGSQTEQPPPSAVFWLDPKDLNGFRFLTISVAPSPTVSGRPPPPASMAVGQFFNPGDGSKEFSALSLLLSAYSRKDIFIKEDHPIAMNITFSISLGLLPATVSVETTGCGIKKSGLSVEEAEAGDMDSGRLCKLRCFPPVALAWEATSGLHIFPNLYSRTIEVDSSPALWSSSQGPEKTNILLLVDPHCSYKTSASVSLTAAARRFMLLYSSQIIGFSFAVVFFGLMRQANAWELDLPVPSLLSAVELNLRMPLPFLLLAIAPILIALFSSSLSPKPFPSVGSFFVVSMICYLLANGTLILLTLTTQILSHVIAKVHVFFKTRWRWWIPDLSTNFFSLKAMRVINANPPLALSLLAIALVCFVHPALGLLILIFSHVLCCHHALCSFFTASSKARKEDLFVFRNGENSSNNEPEEGLGVDENSSSSPDSARSYGDTQLEIFHHRQGLLILHLLCLLMFLPSLVAWLERLSMGHNFPWFLDSMLCIGIVLHGICDTKPEFNVFFQIPGMRGYEIRQGFVYLLAGYCCFLSGLDLAPYKAFYAMAAIGVISFVFRIMERKNRGSGEAYYSSRKHSHRH